MSWRGTLGVPLFVLGVVVVARRTLDVVEVRGRSMMPTLRPGDRLLLVRRVGPLCRGDVVVAPDPRDPARELIKRVGSVAAGGVELRGDNPAASTDARTFGRVPEAVVRWRALARWWPLDRIGPIPAALPFTDLGGEDACAVPSDLVRGDA